MREATRFLTTAFLVKKVNDATLHGESAVGGSLAKQLDIFFAVENLGRVELEARKGAAAGIKVNDVRSRSRSRGSSEGDSSPQSREGLEGGALLVEVVGVLCPDAQRVKNRVLSVPAHFSVFGLPCQQLIHIGLLHNCPLSTNETPTNGTSPRRQEKKNVGFEWSGPCDGE